MTNKTDGLEVVGEVRAKSDVYGGTFVLWKRLPVAGMKLVDLASAQAAVAKRDAEIANLHTVMMAAAVEITEHWDAHCDSEGYGPVNLVRRLENGYPEQYGYDSQTMVRQDKRIASLEADAKRYSYKEIGEELKGYKVKIAALEVALRVARDCLDEAITYTSSQAWSPSMTEECKVAIAAIDALGVK